MKKTLQSRAWLMLIGVAVLVTLPPSESPAATKHIIQFGGALGLVYSPSSLSVAVGDTIQWEGNFGVHPLSSTIIPAGATTWHNDTGTVFSYNVSLPGTYNYRCDNHVALGMTGSFVATSTDVDKGQGSDLPVSLRLDQNYPNPFNPVTNIQFTIVNRQLTIVRVYDVLGSEVATLVNEVKAPGTYSVKFDATGLASGVYFYRLSAVPAAQRDLVPTEGRDGQAGNFVQTRKMLLVR